MKTDSAVYVAGHRGLVGSNLLSLLKAKGYRNLITAMHSELDLTQQADVVRFFRDKRPTHVFLAAAKVGGILANQRRQADFLYDNLMIAANVIHAAFDAKVEKLVFLGSSCIYPKLAPQPLKEDYLLTGPLEPTNEGYAIAKIAGLKLCEKYHEQHGAQFVSAMPTNLYGPGDNFHPEDSHVIPGMMRRFHEAKLSGAPAVTVWGTGSPKREFLHVEDLASGLYEVMMSYGDRQTINVGTGQEVTIRDLASLMKEVVGYPGELKFDASKPDGTPRKVMDNSKIANLGWKPKWALRDGLAQTYAWALESGVFSAKA